MSPPPDHKSHGFPYVQPERHDELSDGVPGSILPAQAGDQKRDAGRYVPGSAETTTNAAKGGETHKGTTKLSHRIEGMKLTPTSVSRARTLRRALAGETAHDFGGGCCGIVASLLIKFAAQKTAAAEEAFERGDFEAHRKLSESARMDVLYAREHAGKAATARQTATAKANPQAAHVALVAALSAPQNGGSK